MTSANVDLVRSIYAAWERGDFSSAELRIPRSNTQTPTDLWAAGLEGWAGWRTESASS